ncbi:MAG: hypothetical protein ABI760_10350 [Ferruginibacter sp.]
MGSNTLIVSEYLASLKEDSKLDYLFPILLSLLGYRIIATPKESRGNKFRSLLTIHFELLQQYFKRTLRVACKPNGLFGERGGPFETIGYPLRSFEYLNYLIYYLKQGCIGRNLKG